MNIELIISNRNDRGYAHACLMIGEEGKNKSDCGMLYLSEDEMNHLVDVVQTGTNNIERSSFEVTDQTLVQEY